jgi:quinol monooxygenase YgiN
MATILAHITVQEGKEKEFEEVLHRLWRSTHEHEDHVLRYEYWRGAEKNQYGFLEHQTSDHHETDAKLLTHLFTDFRVEWIDPISTASPLPETNMQPLIADASDLWKAYHERMPAAVATWWLALRALNKKS